MQRTDEDLGADAGADEDLVARREALAQMAGRIGAGGQAPGVALDGTPPR